MAEDHTRSVSRRDALSADHLAQRDFSVTRRGYDPDEVRRFLGQVAAEVRTLQQRLDGFEAAAAAPPERPEIDEETLMQMVGDETAAILRTARAAAADMRVKAEEEARRLVAEAREQAAEVRTDADARLGTATAEAQATADSIRGAANAEAEAVLDRARTEADAVREQAQQDRRLTVEGAQAVREKILADLSRRRRVATVQIEQLRAGRERLLESYAVVRRTLDEVTVELQRADLEARVAADDAGKRMERELPADAPAGPDPTGPDLGGPNLAGAAPGTQAIAAELSIPPVPNDLGGVGGTLTDLRTTETSAPGAHDVTPISPVTPPPADASSRGTSPEMAAELPGDALAVVTGADASGMEGPPQAADAPAAADVIRPTNGTESVRILPADPATDPGGAGMAPGPAGDPAGAPAVRLRPERIAARRSSARPATKPARSRRRDAASDETDTSGAPGTAASEIETAPEGVAAALEVTDTSAADVATAGEVTTPAVIERVTVIRGTEAAGTEDGAEDTESARSDVDEALLQRRDDGTLDVEIALTRKLKRALQDEQNDLLDRLRGLRRSPKAATFLPEPEAHAARFADAARPHLEEAVRAGATFAVTVANDAGVKAHMPANVGQIDDLADELATSVTVPLRRRLAQAVKDSAGDDQTVLVDALSSAYREWKTQRIERAASDVVAAAFSRGLYQATPAGTQIRWLVDDADGPCPDCDDNALAGVILRGETFPTGQLHPPAHGGCRCVLVPERA